MTKARNRKANQHHEKHRQMTFNWVDPMPNFKTINSPFQQNIGTVFAGQIELDPELPSKIGKPYSDIMYGITASTINDKAFTVSAGSWRL